MAPLPYIVEIWEKDYEKFHDLHWGGAFWERSTGSVAS